MVAPFSLRNESVKLGLGSQGCSIMGPGKSLAAARSIAIFVGICISCVSSAGAKRTIAHYPTPLHGFWLGEASVCPRDGEASDSDMQMHISADLLHGYEDVSKPTRVTLLSSDPMTWRVESLMDVGPSGFYEANSVEIFILGKDALTVVAEGRGNTYKRCHSENKPPSPVRGWTS